MDEQGPHDIELYHDNEANIEDWETKLSSTFTEDDMIFSIIVLGIFYLVYAITKSTYDLTDNNASDEEQFTQSCFCDANQQHILRWLFSLCCVLWFLLHLYTFFSQFCVQRCHKFRNCIRIVPTCSIVCIEYFLCCFYKHSSISSENKYYKEEEVKQLWFEYSKLYVIGYNDYERRQNVRIDTQPQSPPVRNCCCCFQCKTNDQSQNEHNKYSCICFGKQKSCPDLNFICCSETFPFSLEYLIHIPLYVLKYISQLASVPLLLLQIFDTYSFLCFSPNSYCSRTTEYEVHLLQTGITLLFFWSLITSQLANIMLLWSPWGKRSQI